jgi:hypothetical protein
MRRNDLADQLGTVEAIYAEFDYPEKTSNFVRYMSPPLSLGDATGPAALMARWAAYVDREHAALRVESRGLGAANA